MSNGTGIHFQPSRSLIKRQAAYPHIGGIGLNELHLDFLIMDDNDDDLKRLYRLKRQIEFAIDMHSNASNFREMSENEKLAFEAQYGKDAFCLGEFVIKPR